MTRTGREVVAAAENRCDQQDVAFPIVFSHYAIVNSIFLLIGIASIGLLASFEITPANGVRVPWLNIDLPSSCLYMSRTGQPCPSCGLTRSLIAAIHGEFARSHSFHRAGIPLVFMLFVQCGMRIAFLRPRSWQPAADIVISIAMLGSAAMLLNSW